MNTATVDPWTVEVKKAGSGEARELCPAKNLRGAIIGMVDLGHFEVDRLDFKTKTPVKRTERKLAVFFEVSAKQSDGTPFVLSERYTFSMNEQSALYSMVKGATGRSLDAGTRFNPAELLGVPVMVNVVHKTTGGGKTVANVSEIAQYPDDFPPYEPAHKPFRWTVASGEPFPVELDWLPYVYGTPVRDLVAQSNEVRSRNATAAQAEHGSPPEPTVGPGGFDPDNPPF